MSCSLSRTVTACLMLLGVFISPQAAFSQEGRSPSETPDEKVSPAMAFEIRNVIDGQLKAIAQGDISKAYFLFTSSHFRQASNLEAFTQFVNSYSDYWRNAKFDWETLTREGVLIRVRGIATATGKPKMELNYYMYRENGRWKILGLNLSLAPLPNPNLPQPSPEGLFSKI